MPNHVTTRCSVIGEESELARFERQVLLKIDGKTSFDFNAVIPRPAAIANTESSTCAETGAEKLLAAAGNEFAPGVIAARAWIAENPDAAAKGKARLLAIATTGYASWYEWSIANWGTKWNAYEYQQVKREADGGLGHLEFTFQTAWGFPEPVFVALAKEFPELMFDCSCFDEGWNFAGRGQFKDELNEFSTFKASNEMYHLVYGQAYEQETVQ